MIVHRCLVASLLVASLVSCGGGGGSGGDSASSLPPVLDETSVRLLAEVLEDSASVGGAGNANGVATTAEEFTQIAGIEAVSALIESDYQAAILAEVNFSNPVTVAALQALIDSVNALHAVANAASSGDASTINIEQLQAIAGLGPTYASLQSLYQRGIAAVAGGAVDTAAELQLIVDRVHGDDTDKDGLANLSEAQGFELVFDGVARTVYTNPNLADTDGDSLNDGYELYFVLGDSASILSSSPGDTDANGVAGGQRDAVLAADHGVPVKALSGLVDQDGDQMPRDHGIPWYNGTHWSYIATDPTSKDGDGDRVYDAAEIGIQLTFRGYQGFDRASGERLLARLNPSSAHAGPPPFGAGIAMYASEASLEQDSDGGGRPDIEEWWANTNPAVAADDQPYIGCVGPGKPDATGAHSSCSESGRWQAMTAANFRYIPGGFDVNDDGLVEAGYWLSQYEAKNAEQGVAADPDNARGGGSVAEFLSFNFRVYNPATGQFDQQLCEDGGHAADSNGDGVTLPGTAPLGCRSSEYVNLGWNASAAATAGSAGQSAPRVAFNPGGYPLVKESSIEASIALADSPVLGVGVYAIALPSAVDWMQLVSIIIPHELNWSRPDGDGVVELSDGDIVRGHTDSQNSGAVTGSALAILAHDPDDYRQGYDGTGDGNGVDYIANPDTDNDPGQRRTHVVANGMAARDFSVPLDHSVVIWDLGGNVWEWTADLVAARIEVSSTGFRSGGDRFLDGAAKWREFDSPEVDASAMPAWWKPVLAQYENRILGSQHGAGSYYDGANSSGAVYNGGASVGSDYASVRRGGHWSNSGDVPNTGIATTILHSGPQDRRAGVGFRGVDIH